MYDVASFLGYPPLLAPLFLSALRQRPPSHLQLVPTPLQTPTQFFSQEPIRHLGDLRSRFMFLLTCIVVARAKFIILSQVLNLPPRSCLTGKL